MSEDAMGAGDGVAPDIGICHGCGQTVAIKDKVSVRHSWSQPLSPGPTYDVLIVCPGVGFLPVLAWYSGDLRSPPAPFVVFAPQAESEGDEK